MEIALVGNPNTGKTSLFNHLTGSYEYVGNWSGVTVEKKVGVFKGKDARLIDLPGVYTLNPISKDEGVVTNFFLQESFDTLLNILDASQLKRNLHLTIQLHEYGAPMVIGLNMIDVAKMRGIDIDVEKLSALLETPIAPVVARTGKGCDYLAEMVTEDVQLKSQSPLVDYGEVIEGAIQRLTQRLSGKTNKPVRWLGLQLFEGNPYIHSYLQGIIDEREILTFIQSVRSELKNSGVADSLEQYIYKKRNEKIEKIIATVTSNRHAKKAPLSERIDRIVTNKFLGIPVFLLLLYFMFMLTFDWLGFPLSDALEDFISGPLTASIAAFLSAVGVSEFIRALILEGIVAGVGGVLVFVPQIFILFFFISLLEDSGYMARVAMVMDRLMEWIGLNGKAFIPMMIGFGCNVPGIMAARTIETPKERLLTVLLTPMMSCSARLPVYALFVGMFFLQYKAVVVLSLYVLGILIAFILAKLFSKTIFKGETSLFVIELPPYRLPHIRSLWRSTWDKGKGFIKKAGTFIFAGSVVIWLLSYAGPGGADVNMDDSFLAIIGGVLAPIFEPLGFGTWQAGASLLTGFLAKEAIISTMNIIYFVPDEASLQGLLATAYTPLAAYSFMVFILLYIPCLATVATIYKETQSKKWTGFSMSYAFIIAYLLALIIYQGGKLIGLS
ncbi:ferrous iron transport protein B [Bacillus sp. B15-48]|uniref:ferrous iron transport protein B n=1 Tax=Bacillus sp. B15-48 TaxID=1548601 RepID=UPI0019401D99|nr:ferrous iron transport protein B [Bacillus sp. B15-48]MBM4764098.1 ferrous iron transport protein B [Bacillus sp. B15-48]